MVVKSTTTRSSTTATVVKTSLVWLLAIFAVTLVVLNSVPQLVTPVAVPRTTILPTDSDGTLPPPPAWRTAIDSIISPDTAEALANDEQLRRSLGAAAEFSSHLARELAKQYDLPSLHEAGASFAELSRILTTKEQPQSASQQPMKRQLSNPFASPATNPVKNPMAALTNALPNPFAPASSSSPAAPMAAAPNPLSAAAAPGSGMPANMDPLAPLMAPFTNMLSGITDGILKNLNGAALYLGAGVGAGAAEGLNLTTPAVANRVAGEVAKANGAEATGLNLAIQNLGIAVSAALLGALNNGTGALNINSLLGNFTVSQLALNLADGLGGGASRALNLSTAPDITTVVKGNTIPDAAGALGFGLAESVARSVVSGGPNGSSVLGGGGLTDSLQRVFPAGFSIGAVAQGFARGLIQGAGDSVAMMGGVRALANGTATVPRVLPNDVVQFNDTLGGAATGFGQGFGGQGIIVAAQLVANAFPDMLVNTTGTPTMQQRAQVGNRTIGSAGLVTRQQQQVSGAAARGLPLIFNLSSVLNAQTISTGAQSIINILQCEGIGGIGLVAWGLYRGGSLGQISLSGGGIGFDANTTAMIREIVPNGTISFQNRGNVYEIDGQTVLKALDGPVLQAAEGIRVNGLKVITFVVLIAIHIIITLPVFIFILPLTLSLESTNNILARINSPLLVLPKRTPRWVTLLWLFTVAPSLLVSFVFGVAASGSKPAHFSTAHGIIGLLTLVLGFPAVALYHIDTKLPSLRKRIISRLGKNPETGLFRLCAARYSSSQLLQSLAVASVLTGFGDLGGAALCLTQIVPFEAALSVGFGLASLTTIGQLLNTLELYMAWRVSRASRVEEDGSETEVGEEGHEVEGGDEEKEKQKDEEKPRLVSVWSTSSAKPARPPIKQMKILYDKT